MCICIFGIDVSICTPEVDILAHPFEYGLGVNTPIPAALTLGLDETPLLYTPKVRSYDVRGARRVVIRGSAEKRSLTLRA